MRKKLLVFHPIIAPYRIDFFNALTEHYDAEVCLYWRNMKDQTFDYSNLESQFKFQPKYIIREELGTWRWIKRLWNELTSYKPDVVYVGEYGLCTLLAIVYRIIRKTSYKIISIVDDSYNMVAEDHRFSLKHKLATYIIAPQLDEIQTVEPKVTEWYHKKFGRGFYFPIICDDNIAIERQKEVLPISEQYINQYNLQGKKVLLFVGRLVALKNIKFAIKAFAKASIPNTEFIIVGNGEQEEMLKDFAKPYENVKLVGRFEGEKLYAWYNVANIFTLQSILEPFGAVTNEALVAGCKCLISKDAGSNCLINNGENGYIIDPRNECEYVKKLKALMEEAEPITPPLTLRPNLMKDTFNNCIERLFNRIDTL